MNYRIVGAAEPPAAGAEAWMCHLQWLHLLEGEIRRSRLARWADWLLPPLSASSSSGDSSPDTPASPPRVSNGLAAATNGGDPLPTLVRGPSPPQESTPRLPSRPCRLEDEEEDEHAAAAAAASVVLDSSLPEAMSPGDLAMGSARSEESIARTGEAGTADGGGAVARVVAVILEEFEEAEAVVDRARRALVAQGYPRPSPGHVLQVLGEAAKEQGEGTAVHPHPLGCVSPSTLFLASAALGVSRGGQTVRPGALVDAEAARPRGTESGGAAASATLEEDEKCVASGSRPDWPASGVGGAAGHTPEDPFEDDEDEWFGVSRGSEEAFGSWGYRDSGFALVPGQCGGRDPYVVMRGGRCGHMVLLVESAGGGRREAGGGGGKGGGRVCRASITLSRPSTGSPAPLLLAALEGLSGRNTQESHQAILIGRCRG